MPPVAKVYHWYVLYTKTKHEAVAECYLKSCGIETFLPRHKVLHQWSDRKKWIEEPLFPSYIFARLSNKEFEKSLQHSSIFCCIKSGNYPCILPDSQIDSIRAILEHKICFSVSNKTFEPGDQVEIGSGLLAGRKAEVVKCKGKEELILRLDCINQNLVITTSCRFVRIGEPSLAE
jgi:transcriptional antiterminator RfaH